MALTAHPPPQDAIDVDAGVIEEAQRRQRRHRVVGTVALAAAVLTGALALGFGGGSKPPRSVPPVRLASSLTWLTGPSLGATHLQLVASGNAGPAFIVDVDSGRVRALPQLGLPTRQTTRGPFPYALMLVAGRALAVVSHQTCAHCAITEDDFLIAADGVLRRIATRHFPREQRTTQREYVPGSTVEWVLTWPRHGRCTLHLIPSTHAALIVPCGDLGPVFAAGVVLFTHGEQRVVLVDPLTGAVRRRLSPTYVYNPVGHGLALEGVAFEVPSMLSLVNLTTGTRRRLRWPSIFHFGINVFPEPHGPLVAVGFNDPTYTKGEPTTRQAADMWVLDTRTGNFTHVPGFPILERLQASGVAWTADNRLVVVAQGGGRTAIGVWRAGQRTLPVRTVPALGGYPQFVPLVR